MAIQPPESAEKTFCRAAIATTMGMYIALQKPMPFSVNGLSFRSAGPRLESTSSRSMAMPTPPTLAWTPMTSPSMSPRNTPTSMQNDNNATP